MDEFGILAKDFGFRPQGKSAPMKSTGGDRRSRPTSSSTTFTADGNDMFHDVFGGGPKFTNSNSKSTSSMTDFDYDSIFKDSVSVNNKNNNEMKSKPRVSNSPVYDTPVYDDDMFDKTVSSSANLRYDDDVFASVSGYSNKQTQQSDQFDDLLGNLGRTEKAEPSGNWSDKSSRGLDDLIPGFGSSSPVSSSRWNSDPSPTSTSNPKEKSNAVDDPFASSEGFFTDPLEQFSNIDKSKSTKSGVTSPSEDVFGDMDSFDSFNKSPPASSNETHIRKKGQSQNHSEERSSVGSFVSSEPIEEYSFGFTENQPQKMPFDQTGTSSNVDTPPKSEEHAQHTNDIWLTVLEIPLFTPVTRDPPPSRPPPPIPAHGSSTRTFDDDFSSSSASTKYSHNANASKMDEEITQKRLEREREEEEREQRRLEKEKTREIEREKARQAVERANKEARERAATEARLKAERAAVQRAQTEARERAAVEAREKADRAAAEKAATEAKEKEAREKEKEAHEKEKEAREKERAAVARAQAEARRRAERAAVDRVTAEARERAAAEARERAAAAAAEARERAAAAAAAKTSQQRNDNDLDSFFSMGSPPNSVPKARTNFNDSATDPLSQDKRGPEGAHRASSSAVPSNVRKASSTANFVDDLSSIFGGGMPAGEFQDVEGETEERRRARLERQQRTQERAAKALAEKNQRDQQIQNEQEERQRISATLDVEIRRWAAGKEGNLRAMLSTLQYVLWPECGWQPVSLTDLITGASVKKVYRKATLCIHPDKVQQKGANLQQKYVAEKVFDLLKEAWNKFNSEELF
ncbi:putative Chaperone J-domain superfamily [Helianthus annuus]|nr:putative Chaperone J-domain superfamily [Helianthus annuus]